MATASKFDPYDYSMVVKEEYNGKVTGTWDLVLGNDELGNTTLSGTMTNYKGNTYPVLLSTGGFRCINSDQL